jgi:hypothetical protein
MFSKKQMKNKKLFLISAIIFFFIYFAVSVQAGSVTTSLFYEETASDSLTIIDGNTFGVIISADSIFESSMNIKLDLLDSSGNIVTNLLEVYTTDDSYFKSLAIEEYAYSNPGSYSLKASVIGASGNSDTDYLALVVLPKPPVNNVPVITSSPVTQVNEKQAYFYQVTASDADGDNLIYSLTQNPSWLSINSQTGLLSGTSPEVSSDYSYAITIMVSDGKDSATQSYSLLVKNVLEPPVNNVPVITSSPVTQVNEKQAYFYQVTASDADGDNLIYSLTQNPSWLSINSQTGLLSGTSPEVSSDYSYAITIMVSDGKDSATQSYAVTVKDTNIVLDTIPPVISLVSPIEEVYDYHNLVFEITTNEHAIRAWFVLDAGNENNMPEVSNNRFSSSVNVGNGHHFLVFYAEDESGNIGSSEIIEFDVKVTARDTTAPVVNITNPINGATYNTKQITVSYTASDLNLKSCFYSLNGAPNAIIACNTPFAITALEGANTLTIYADDNSGNIGSKSVTFYVDTSATGKKEKSAGTKYISDSDEEKKYLEQFNQITTGEEKETLALEKPVSVQILIVWLLASGVLILMVALIIFWIKR